MRVIAENMANSDSTAQTKGGDPYRRQVPVFAPLDVEGATGVQMKGVTPDPKPFPTEYNPGRPRRRRAGVCETSQRQRPDREPGYEGGDALLRGGSERFG